MPSSQKTIRRAEWEERLRCYAFGVLVGLISDTHGYFDPRVPPAFEGVELILHAGDVGKAEVLERLARIAPVHAVEGNNDAHLAALGLPLRLDVEIAGLRLHLVHQLPHATPGPNTAVVVYGHSHRAVVETKARVLSADPSVKIRLSAPHPLTYVNPGAAGRAGFHRLQTVALLEITPAGLEARIVELGPRQTLRRDSARSRIRARSEGG